MLTALKRAFGLLTILPVRASVEETVVAAEDAAGVTDADRPTPQAASARRPAPGASLAYYPLVGVVIGGVLAGVTALLAWSGLTDSVPLLSAALVLAVWVGVTGALHLDGWADCCDALLVPVDRERRLQIMKDPHLGGFGAAGLVLLLLVKFAALQGVLGRPGGLWALVAVVAAARWAATTTIYAFPSARPEGMGAHFREGVARRHLVVATVIAFAAAAPLMLAAPAVIAAAALAGLIVAVPACGRLGGLTGDVYGAVIEAAETLALIALCFVLR